MVPSKKGMLNEMIFYCYDQFAGLSILIISFVAFPFSITFLVVCKLTLNNY